MEKLFSTFPNSYFFLKNADGRFISCCDNMLRVYGLTNADDIIGKTDADIMPRFMADSIMKDDRIVMKTEKPILDRFELAPSDDFIPDWRLTSKIPIFSKSGDVIGLAGITRVIRSEESIYRGHPEVSAVLAHIRANYMNKISIDDIARVAEMSVSSIERVFKHFFKTTPIKYLKKVRLNVACKLLRGTSTPIPQIAKECGFYDQSSMNRDFRSVLNLTPLKYRKRFRR